MTPDTENTRAGFVAVIGAPNAGKSTLVNRMVGAKVAIVTQKVQTTRFPVRGIAMVNDAQLVLVDTPGIFRTRRRLDRAMVKAALAGAEEADVILHVIDATGWVAEKLKRPLTPAQKRSMEDDRRVMDDLKELGRPAILALNKIDEFDHLEVLPVIQELSELGIYSDIFPISASNGDGVSKLADHLSGLVPESPYLYDPEQTADLPMRLLAAEVTREKLMLRLHERGSRLRSALLPIVFCICLVAWATDVLEVSIATLFLGLAISHVLTPARAPSNNLAAQRLPELQHLT